jgi:hypothetical protein
MSSERIFQKEDGRWYFRIRGNTSMGPYTSHREANDSLNRYVASCKRQAEMSLTWPRWMHVKYWARRFNETQHQPAATRARQA